LTLQVVSLVGFNQIEVVVISLLICKLVNTVLRQKLILRINAKLDKVIVADVLLENVVHRVLSLIHLFKRLLDSALVLYEETVVWRVVLLHLLHLKYLTVVFG
jgi:hypothetical protein